MFFIDRYRVDYIDFRETVKEIKSWSFEPSKKAIVNKLDKFSFLDNVARNILLAKLSFILKNHEQYLDLDNIDEINLFLKRKLGEKDNILDINLLNYPDIQATFIDVFPIVGGGRHEVFNDTLLITVLEVILVFVDAASYKKIQKEFSRIFIKNTKLNLQDYLVFFNVLPDLKYQLHLIKDSKLQHLLERYYIYEHKDNYQMMAKISADIIKKVFFPKPAECKELVVNSILNDSFSIDEKRKKEKEEIKGYLESRFDFVTSVIDKVYNIRHTEEWTVNIKDEYVYKMIASACIDFTTLYIKADKKYLKALPKSKKVRNDYYKEFSRIKQLQEDKVENIPCPGDIPF